MKRVTENRFAGQAGMNKQTTIPAVRLLRTGTQAKPGCDRVGVEQVAGMRWLLIGIVWLFLWSPGGPRFCMASQSFSEGLAAFWTEISRPEALHGFTLTAEIR